MALSSMSSKVNEICEKHTDKNNTFYLTNNGRYAILVKMKMVDARTSTIMNKKTINTVKYQ